MSAAIQGNDLVGRMIGGRIVIDQMVGAGAMGAVYRGHHIPLDKVVAVKVMHPAHDERVIRTERFTREAQTAARLDHPNIVRVLDFGADDSDGLLYIVMEYIEGYDVGQLLARTTTIPETKACEIMVQVLSALASAHDAGVVHRDIKPANIMLLKKPNDDGELVDFTKVCDFGLAKALHYRAHVTYEGRPTKTVIGTPLYMSPEQAVGDALDGRSDIYSCGVVLYEMLTGQPPFDGEQAFEVLMKHISEAPLPPSRMVRSLSQSLERIVLAALAKSPNDRIQNAREFRRALLEHLGRSHHTPVPPPPSRPTSRTQPPLSLPPTQTLPPPTIEWLVADLQPVPMASSPDAAPEALPLDAIIGAAPPSSTELRSPLDGSEADTDDLESRINAAVSDVVEEVHGEVETSPVPRATDTSLGLAGIDFRKHGAAVSDCAQYMWKHYGVMFNAHVGPYQFWVRDHNREILGPLDYKDMLIILRQEGLGGHGHEIGLSSDGKTWVSATSFVRLTGQETLLSAEIPTTRDVIEGANSGDLEHATLASVFAKFTRERSTGRLFFRRSDLATTEQIEIHLVNGSPTFVSTTEPSLELPHLIVGKNLVRRDMIPRIFHVVLADERPIEEIVYRLVGVDLVPYRPTFMKSRLLHLFRWKRRGDFAFDAGALPASMTTFAPSLLAVLPELVYHAYTQEELHYSVWPYFDRPCDRSPLFAGGVRQLNLPPSMQRIANKFGEHRRLDESLLCEPHEQRIHLALAYTLLETGLIIPQGGLSMTL